MGGKFLLLWLLIYSFQLICCFTCICFSFIMSCNMYHTDLRKNEESWYLSVKGKLLENYGCHW